MNADLKNLQGTWNIVALEVNGQVTPAAMLNGAGIAIEDERFQAFAMGAAYGGTVAVNPDANPKAFDLHFTEGPESGNVNYGIYELDGDTWKICLNMLGKARPETFASEPGSGNALEILKRGPCIMEAAPGAPAIAVDGPSGLLDGEWSMVSCMRDGYPLDPPMVKSGRRVATGTETSTFFGPQLFMKASYTIDPAQSPGAIDYRIMAGMGVGQQQLGIYELDGASLKLCFAVPGQPRPADFKSALGDQRTLTVWKRERQV